MNFTHETFADETVDLDDNAFFECILVRCTLVYKGSGTCSFASCNIHSPQFVFTDAAARTLDFMSKLYANGGANIIEATFDQIRKGNTSADRDLILGAEDSEIIN